MYWNWERILGSETEERDIRKAYLGGKGCINYMMNSVPFMTVEDEPRIMELVKGKLLNFSILSKIANFLNYILYYISNFIL